MYTVLLTITVDCYVLFHFRIRARVLRIMLCEL